MEKAVRVIYSVIAAPHASIAVSFVVPVILVGVVLPTSAQAGVFSNFLSAIGGVIEYRAASLHNSQTLPLPFAAKNIDPNPSKGGGDITVVDGSALLPETGPVGTIADISEGVGGNGQISLYVVREGDSLSAIADMFDVTVNTIRWSNDLKSDEAIQPGQELVILPITGIKYTVKTGGTLADIIKKYGGDLSEAAQYNGYAPYEELAAGTEVIIPDGELAAPAPVKTAVARVSTQPRGTDGPSYVGYYIRPVTNAHRSQGIHGYNGVDLAAPSGTPIVAAAAGTVIISKGSGWNGGYGQYVVIRHDNGTQTLYAHNSNNIVYQGQSVVQGQVIAYMGSTGRSTGSHVHFEVRGAKNPF